MLAGYRQDASPIEGDPEGLWRPREPAEVAPILARAQELGVPVTACGQRTSTTGSGLALRGWALSTELLTQLELRPRERVAVVGAGVILGALKDSAAEHGLFYPPDPTSERECSVGGTIACDASGARSFRYGPTHRWVRALQVALPDGSLRWLRRPATGKDAAGPAALRDPVRMFCGSEGTLGVVTAAELQLIERPAAVLAGLALFRDVRSALAFVGSARRPDSALRPRCLELLDAGCLEIMRTHAEGGSLPGGAGAGVFFEEEHEGDDDDVMERWWERLSGASGCLAGDTVIATSPASHQRLRDLRHAVPAALNEEGHARQIHGGRKISTDWSVPFDALAPLMTRADAWLREAGLNRAVRYGHVGDGHPHYNIIAADTAEAARAHAVVDRMCREACAVGGTVTAEHGIGKVKLAYARYRFSALDLRLLRAIKAELDPRGVLAPGNLLP